MAASTSAVAPRVAESKKVSKAYEVLDDVFNSLQWDISILSKRRNETEFKLATEAIPARWNLWGRLMRYLQGQALLITKSQLKLRLDLIDAVEMVRCTKETGGNPEKMTAVINGLVEMSNENRFIQSEFIGDQIILLQPLCSK